MESELPVGILPMGRFNNIAHYLYKSVDPKDAIAKIIGGDYKKTDSGMAADQPFFNAIGIGFLPELADSLKSVRTPRFGFGWSQIGSKAAAAVKIDKLVAKIDAFRFEISPVMMNVHLPPYAVGLPFASAALGDDGQAEVIFDQGGQIGEFLDHYADDPKREILLWRRCSDVSGENDQPAADQRQSHVSRW